MSWNLKVIFIDSKMKMLVKQSEPIRDRNLPEHSVLVSGRVHAYHPPGAVLNPTALPTTMSVAFIFFKF